MSSDLVIAMFFFFSYYCISGNITYISISYLGFILNKEVKRHVLIADFSVSSRGTSILPGKYGYGRGLYVPLQTDAGRRSEAPNLHKQRRSAAATSHHPSATGRSSFRSTNPNHLHHFSRPAHSNAHLRHNQVWAPLYQPSSSDTGRVQPEVNPRSQERPYNPLPTSSCSGEHAHYRICNSNVRKPVLTCFLSTLQSLINVKIVNVVLDFIHYHVMETTNNKKATE